MSSDQLKTYGSWAVTILLVVAGGYYLYNRTPTTPGEESASSITEPVTWKTYARKELGFEIQYPSDWKITEYPDEGKDGRVYTSVHFSAPTNSKSTDVYDPNTNHSFLYLHVSSHSGSNDLKYIFGATSYDQDIIISGVPAIRRGPVPTPIAGDGLPVERMPVIPHSLRSTIEMIYDGKTYSLIGESTGPDYIASQEVLDRMLSTFKLLK